MSPVAGMRRKLAFSYISLAGFVAGTLDILAACIQFYISTGRGPVPVLRYISSAVLGKKAYQSIIPSALFGLFLHYLVAFIFTVFFFWIYPKLRLQLVNKFLLAIIYGVIVWLIMNLVVVRLSYAPQGPFVFDKALLAMAILVVCIGLPLSFIIGKHYTEEWKMNNG